MNYEINLDEITKKNTQDLFEIYSDPNVCKYFDFQPFKRIDEVETQIQNWNKLRENNKQIRYGIFLKNKLIGTCGIYSIYWHQNRASLGYDLNYKYWNQGIITHAIELLLFNLKKEYGLHRIQATLLKENIASKKVLIKLGFDYEGTLRDYEKWKGNYVNLEIYSKIL